MNIAIEVSTKDCTSLADAELAEMADICTDIQSGYGVGFLSKQREDWVLVTEARDAGKLRGFALSTLERIGGTPSLLVGVASFTRTSVATVDPALSNRSISACSFARAGPNRESTAFV